MLAQPLGQIAVELDDRQAAKPLDQRLRERRQPRPDLDHRIAGLRRDRLHDPVDDPAVGQEMLSEPLSCNVLCHRGLRRCRGHQDCGVSRYST
ncbi:hypothetical protein D9M69_479900 [compost metagenome]